MIECFIRQPIESDQMELNVLSAALMAIIHNMSGIQSVHTNGIYAPRIEWNIASLSLVREGGGYGRMLRLHDGRILCVYERGGRVFSSASRDNGKSWNDEVLASSITYGYSANPEALQLQNGKILLFTDDRPTDGIHPFAIRMCQSNDAKNWSVGKTVYEADTRSENGCWEPAAVQMPDHSVWLFFANENPYRDTSEQEISLMRSIDDGESWSQARTASFRKVGRDGMPVPLLMKDRHLLLAIEESRPDNNVLQPCIEMISATDSEPTVIMGDDSRRRHPFQMEQGVYGGAPYVRQMKSGEIIFSYQSNAGGNKLTMRVRVGDSLADNFGLETVPFLTSSSSSSLWNSLFVKDAKTITALSTTTIRGVHGLWAIDGKLVMGGTTKPEGYEIWK